MDENAASGEPNPYPAILGSAEYIISTIKITRLQTTKMRMVKFVLVILSDPVKVISIGVEKLISILLSPANIALLE